MQDKELKEGGEKVGEGRTREGSEDGESERRGE